MIISKFNRRTRITGARAMTDDPLREAVRKRIPHALSDQTAAAAAMTVGQLQQFTETAQTGGARELSQCGGPQMTDNSSRGPVHDGTYPLKPGLGTGGVDTLRATVRHRGRHGPSALSWMARDCGTGLEALEQFAHGHANLPEPVLQKIAEYVFGGFKRYDAATNTLVSVDRPKYVSEVDRCSQEWTEKFRQLPDNSAKPFVTQIERDSEVARKRFLENQRKSK